MGGWTDHYGSLLKEDRQQFIQQDDKEGHSDETQSNLQTTIQEVREAIQTLKNNRAPGPGGIMAEMIKYGGDLLLEQLTNLMNMCLRALKLPRVWKTSYIVSVYKKGKRSDPNNYRGLSINCTLTRLFGKIIKKELYEAAGDKIGEDQSGFTRNRSCVDNLFIIQQLIEKRNSRDEETHLALVDLEKAYDSVPRLKLWQALHSLGLNPQLIKLLKELYNDNITYVKVGSTLSQPIVPTKGLRQGCPLSPMLFNLYLEVALKDWKYRCGPMGVPVGDDFLFNIHFADDQIVIAQDAFDLEFMLRRLHSAYDEWGLKINTEKTEYLVVNSMANFQVMIDDNSSIKQVNQTKYLGAIIGTEGTSDREIRSRMEKSRKVLGCLNSIWWDKNISKSTKVRIGKTLVESVLTYGSEVWTMSAAVKRKLNAIEMDYLRRGARRSRRERVRNEEIRSIMDAHETVVERVEKRRLRWFGHVLRMNPERWPHRMYHWQPPGKRKRGRPRRSWIEGVRQSMEERHLNEEDAQDRRRWRLGVGMQI